MPSDSSSLNSRAPIHSSLVSRARLTPAVLTLVLLIGLNLLNYIDRYILPGEVSLIQRELHSTDAQMGALTTALFLTYMIAAPLTGWLGDHFKRKPLIMGGAVLWSLATLGTAWAGGPGLTGILLSCGCPRSLAFGDRGGRKGRLAVAHKLGQLPVSPQGGPLRFNLYGPWYASLIVPKA